MALDTITDFDFGVGDSSQMSPRVAYGPRDVTKSEVDLIIWLMLEQQFRKVKPRKIVAQGSRTQHDGSPTDEDEEDCDDDIIDAQSFAFKLAKTKAQAVLKEAGIEVMLPDLTEEYRERMLRQLCRSSDLFRDRTSFQSVPKLFQALRSTSKFLSTFHVIKSLGKGQFGEVYHVTQEGVRDQEFAVKKISVSFDTLTTLTLDDIIMAINESKLLKHLKGHENIVKMYDYWLEIEPADIASLPYTTNEYDDDYFEYEGPLKFYIQLEMCGESLQTWKDKNLKSNTKPDASKVLDISFQIFNGLFYMHENNILHLDINPKNIVWQNERCEKLKIVDFGFAVLGDSFGCRNGTPPFVAKEEIMTSKSDVYSAALTIIYVAKNIVSKQELLTFESEDIFDVGVPILDTLLPVCLEKDPNRRPEARTVKES